MDPDSGGPKHVDPVDPDPYPQHCPQPPFLYCSSRNILTVLSETLTQYITFNRGWERGVCTLALCGLASVTSWIDPSVRTVTKSPKVGLIFSISRCAREDQINFGDLTPFNLCVRYIHNEYGSATLHRWFVWNLSCSRTLSGSCPLSGEARPPIRQEVKGLRLLYKAPTVSAKK